MSVYNRLVGGIVSRDATFGGDGYISGTVAIDSTPDIPVKRKVRLLTEDSAQLAREQWSKADGSYLFDHVDRSREFFAVSHDHTRVYNAAVSDFLTPVARALEYPGNADYFANTIDAAFLFSKTKLQLHFDGTNNSTTITDVRGHTVTCNGDAKLTTSGPLFGTACGILDGDDWYYSSSSDYACATGDFEIEVAVYLTARNSSADTIFDLCNGNGSRPNGFAIGCTPAGAFYLFSNSVYAAQSANGAVPLNTWTRLSAQRSGGKLTLRIDGATVATGSLTASMTDSQVWIGTPGNVPGLSGYGMVGKVDEVRFTHFARHTADYTPDTGAFPDA